MYFDDPHTPDLVPPETDQPRRPASRGQLREAAPDLLHGRRPVEGLAKERIILGAVTHLLGREDAVVLHAVGNHEDPLRRLPRAQLGALARMAVAHCVRLAGMQRRHTYPWHRNQWPTDRVAHPGATIDMAPVPPLTAARTHRIRAIFLHDFNGRASVHELVDACDQAGLLDALGSYRSAYETVRAAVGPISRPR
jgi:hypothetical protein